MNMNDGDVITMCVTIAKRETYMCGNVDAARCRRHVLQRRDAAAPRVCDALLAALPLELDLRHEALLDGGPLLLLLSPHGVAALQAVDRVNQTLLFCSAQPSECTRW
jgi:hypothetical protein